MPKVVFLLEANGQRQKAILFWCPLDVRLGPRPGEERDILVISSACCNNSPLTLCIQIYFPTQISYWGNGQRRCAKLSPHLEGKPCHIAELGLTKEAATNTWWSKSCRQLWCFQQLQNIGIVVNFITRRKYWKSLEAFGSGKIFQTGKGASVQRICMIFWIENPDALQQPLKLKVWPSLCLKKGRKALGYE